MSLDRETRPRARTSCLAASMTACGWCSPASMRTTRSLSPVSRKSPHRTPRSNPTWLRWAPGPSRNPKGDASLDFSRFFIDRPIFAAVLSIVIFVAGAIAIPLLPISEYPDVVPPTVVVQATYPGANPKVIAETVSSPLEEQINGVENMMYMKSVAGSDGVLQMTITFAPGTDPNKAQVDVQNRVSQALSRLPSEVVSLGVTTQKQSPAFLTLITLISDGKYDPLYLRNYVNIRVKDQLARIPGVGQIRLFGGGDYAMRVWLNPDKVASRGMTAGDVVRAIQEQN